MFFIHTVHIFIHSFETLMYSMFYEISTELSKYTHDFIHKLRSRPLQAVVSGPCRFFDIMLQLQSYSCTFLYHGETGFLKNSSRPVDNNSQIQKIIKVDLVQMEFKSTRTHDNFNPGTALRSIPARSPLIYS